MDPKVLAVAIPGLVFQGVVLSWINKLEKKCECSADWRRDFIKYYSFILILVSLLAVAKIQIKNAPVMVLLGLVGLVNVVSVLTYIPDLKKKQCDCAIENDWRDNFIFWWIITSLILSFVAVGAAGFISARK